MAGSNAQTLIKRYRDRISVLDYATMLGLRRAAIKVDRKQVENLSGSNMAIAGSWPVPNRSGNLMKGHGFAVIDGGKAAQVYNTTVYAMAIHEGENAKVKGGRARRRPFLDQAAAKVDVLGEVQGELRNAWAFQGLSR